VQLQELEQLHDIGLNVAYLEIAIIIIGGLHDGKEYAKTGTVYKINVFQVQDEFGMGLLIELLELLFDGFSCQGVETAHILKSYNRDVLYGIGL
jgi:hypothetical protein